MHSIEGLRNAVTDMESQGQVIVKTSSIKETGEIECLISKLIMSAFASGPSVFDQNTSYSSPYKKKNEEFIYMDFGFDGNYRCIIIDVHKS